MTVEVPVEGLKVGHYSDLVGLTGCTVVLAPLGVTASVDIRGGAPGSLETALLSPFSSVGELHALLLTGGSAPGLGAAAGVSAFLKEQGYGYRTQYARIPLVAGAVIYDLGVGSAEACPHPEDAYWAAKSASSTIEEGSVGVGTGATVGKILGAKGMMKGGIALSTAMVGQGVSVSALSVVNAFGDVLDETGCVLAGAQRDGEFVGSKDLLLAMPCAPNLAPLSDTTLTVIMTDGRLDKLQCALVARMAHDGQARAVDPIHTPVDGDCVFVLATGQKETNVFQVGVAAADAVAQSIRRAVRVACSLDGIEAVADRA
jgi:L-aminopeptidase/D-esterase-like protein